MSIRKESHRTDVSSRPLPLIQVATKVSRALLDLDADLRAGGFCRNSRGLARELYASFAATVVATHQTEAETLTWAIGRSLATDLDAAGASQSAGTLLAGLIELGQHYPNARSLELLRKTKEAIEPRMGRSHRAAAGTVELSNLCLAAASSLRALHRTVASSLRAVSVVESSPDRGLPIADSPGDENGNTSSKRNFPLPSSELAAEITRRARANVRSIMPLWWHRHPVRASVLGAAAGVALAGLTYSVVATVGALGQHPFVASSKVASASATVLSGDARRSDGARIATAPAIVTGDDVEGAVESWSRGVRAISRKTFEQLGQWLNKLEPVAKRIAATSASQSEPLLDLKSHDGAKAVQARLRSLGYYRHKVDGVWGPKSAAALSSFRRDLGLGSTTAWDLATQSALLGTRQ